MLKHFRTSAFMAAVAILLYSCAGEDGAPGPQGQQGQQGDQGTQGENGQQGIPGLDAVEKAGHFQGTITGFRKDGTAFEETFNYEYAFGVEAFNEQGILTLQRFPTAAGAIMAGTVYDPEAFPPQTPPDEKGYFKLSFTESFQTGELTPFDFQFSFVKQLTTGQVFKLRARNRNTTAAYNTLLPISIEKIGYYDFLVNDNNLDFFEYDVDFDDVIDSYYFNGKKASPVYDMATGELVFVEDQVTFDQITEGPVFDKYNELRFDQDHFVDVATNTALYELVEDVDPDEITIENYQHVDGVISFDFTINISKHRGVLTAEGALTDAVNTTYHDLTITGSFNSGTVVYTDIVSRKRSN